MNSFTFYVAATLIFLSISILGFFSGKNIFYDLLISNFGEPHGEGILAFYAYTAIFSIACFIAGIIVALIVIHKMGRRWGKDLNFGSHPVLKLTTLSFFSFLLILFLLLWLYSLLNP